MKLTYKIVLGAMLILVGALVVWHLLPAAKTKPVAAILLQQRQKQFVQYVDTIQLQDKTPVLESASPLCAKDSSSGQTYCTLSKTFIYKLDGNYRDNGKKIFAYLKSKGFDFPKNSKYKTEVEMKLNNPSLSDNLSNSQPIIVDLYNPKKQVRVRVNLGDRGRTMPYANGQGMDQLSGQQLIAGLQFFNP